jgi:hypothetical protein
MRAWLWVEGDGARDRLGGGEPGRPGLRGFDSPTGYLLDHEILTCAELARILFAIGG